MASENDINGKVSLDIGDFKANISALNQQIKVIETGFKASAAGMDDWGSNADGLQSRIKALNDVMGLQQQKIDNLKSMYAQIAAAKGEDSRAAQDLQIKINNETAALNKNQLELKDVTDRLNNLGKETDDAGTEVKQLGDKMDDAGEKTSIFGDVLKASFLNDAIVGGIRAIGNAIQGAFSKLKEMATGAIESADSLMALSSETGLTTEQLQVMQYVGDDLGVSLDTQTGAMSKLVKNMSGAKDGTGSAAAAFKALGISVTDSNGQLRNSTDVYSEALGALGGVGNETERDAMAMALFGKSARELNPLIEAGADGLAQLEQQAKDTGAVMSDETVAALDSLGDTIDHLKQSAQTAAGTFVAQFVPALSAVATSFSGLLNGSVSVDAFVSKVSTLVTQVASAITAALPAIIQVGGGIITSLLTGIIQALPAIVPAAVDVIMQLSTTLIENLPLLIDAALQIVIALANGLATNLPTLIPTIVNVMLQIVDTLINNVDQLVDAAIAIIIALAEGLIQALPKLIEKAPEIIIKLARAIIANTPKLLVATVQIIAELAKGLSGLGKEALQWGADMLTGFVNGVNSKIKALIDSVKNVAGTIASYLHFSVPDKGPLSEYEAWMPDFISGLAAGIEANKYKIENAIGGLAQQMSGGMSLNAKISANGSAGGFGMATTNLYLDSRQLLSATSPVQYTRNNTVARSYGVVLA